MTNTHPDYSVLSLLRDALYTKANDSVLMNSLQEIIIYAQDKLCEIGKRNTFHEVSVEGKAYFAVCLEERLRDDIFQLPKGKHDMNVRSLFQTNVSLFHMYLGACEQAQINNYFDVDVKNSINGINNTIPPECINDICFMIADSLHANDVSFGLFVARDEYLKPCTDSGPGRDKKRALNANGKNSILWLSGPRKEFGGKRPQRVKTR